MPLCSVSGPRAWAVLLGTVPVAAMAQSSASGPSPTQLPAVEVRERAETPRLAQPAAAASRLGLAVRETPASIDVVPREMLAERGLRTVSEAAQAAVGVLAGDFPAEPAAFSMRGFANSQINTLYNGIKIGPPNMTSRVMGTANLERVEFLKGPASLMSGEGAAGGAVNFVTRAPHRGPVETEVTAAAGSFGERRLSVGTGGTTAWKDVDFRLDASGSDNDGFVRDTGQRLWHLSGGLDWHLQPGLKLFVAAEVQRDRGHPYWGTPLVSASVPGIQPEPGVVSGTYVSGFNGSVLAPVAIDRRTLRTNYNVLDNRNEARETWLRTGVDWRIDGAWSLRSQFYRYTATRSWLNNEVLAFNTGTGLVDRERFFVAQDQTTTGNKTEVQWDGRLAGRENRFVAALELSDTDLDRPGAANFPGDSVSLLSPDRGFYGPLVQQRQTTQLRNAAVALEDRLRITPAVALIAGLRHESIELDRTSTDAAGAARRGFPYGKTWHPTTGRLGLTWEPAAGTMLYAQAATGADVAANNIFLLGPSQPLELTRARNTEVGVKQGFWQDRGEWTLALYDAERRNVYAGQGGQSLARAGALHSRGAELSLALRPAAALSVWAQLALNRARYDDFVLANGTSFSGNTPPNTPKVMASVGAAYRFTAGLPMQVSASLRHVGERFHSDANTVRLSAYRVIDAAWSVDVAPGTQLTLRGRNLANKVYAAWADPFYPDQILLGAPRSFELALRWTL
ncbi:TonB-dependent receptor [Paracidovorax avenae ATCC 19860]|uniref:TonB-dependent receptor n=1 Tax=Paracidovorax avenae (strain ATCC 19860 / DSM 7227 / CCUG 15838 / JCM 20985 / LMG 2117 / NCPPB 1011) TaxID=643561 RepID=F0Q844_PARA1|nr:TonB-dependent receptor [Paracidovorax avenae]ADX45842.1 TonB-dependent receptor [Paracidovorax avenae ATCC 19860]